MADSIGPDEALPAELESPAKRIKLEHPDESISPTRTTSLRGIAPVDEVVPPMCIFEQLPDVPQAHEDLLRRLEHKEEGAEIGGYYLDCLKTYLQENVSTFPEFRTWLHDIGMFISHYRQPRSWDVKLSKRKDTMRISNAAPKILIGLWGSTGVGKSSLLNALLNQTLLHCNPMRAGTAVVTVVSYNNDPDPARRHRAAIRTVTMEEWKAELSILFRDIQDLQGEGGDLNASFSGTDAGIALAKIKAVYPLIDIKQLPMMSVDQLLVNSEVTKVLGTTHEFANSQMVKMKRDMSRFINSHGAADGSEKHPVYWPLVAQCTIYSRAKWLYPNINLVDLPGVGDSSAARNNVAAKFLKNLDYTWVVTTINRAVDDKMAEELLEGSLKRQALVDGKLNAQHISFIMTKADEIVVSEVQSELNLGMKPDFRELNESLDLARKDLKDARNEQARLDYRIKKATKYLRKKQKGLLERKNNQSLNLGLESSMDEGDELAGDGARNADISTTSELAALKLACSDAERAVLALQTELIDVHNRRTQRLEISDKIRAKLKAYCIKARNEWSSSQMRQKFEQEMFDFRMDLAEEEGDTAPNRADSSTSKLDVFCVSAKAYHQFHGRNRNELEVFAVAHEDDTQIPQLRQHCIESSLPARDKTAMGFLKELSVFNGMLQTWADDKSPETQISRSTRDSLDRIMSHESTNLQKVTALHSEALMKDVSSTINGVVAKRLQKATVKGEKKMEEIVRNWYEKTSSMHITHVVSMMAAIRRMGGPHKIKRIGRVIDLNENLSAPFSNHVAVLWEKTFTEGIPGKCASYTQSTLTAVRSFATSLSASVEKENPSIYIRMQAMLAQQTHLEGVLRKAIETAFEQFKASSNEVFDVPMKRMVLEMQPLYRTCDADKGRGIGKRNQERMIAHTSEIQKGVFKDAQTEMSDALGNAAVLLEASISVAVQSFVERLADDFRRLLNRAEQVIVNEGPRPVKVEAQRRVSQFISDLKKTWNGETTGNITFAGYLVQRKDRQLSDKKKGNLRRKAKGKARVSRKGLETESDCFSDEKDDSDGDSGTDMAEDSEAFSAGDGDDMPVVIENRESGGAPEMDVDMDRATPYRKHVSRQ